MTDSPAANAAKIRAILEARDGQADLYRTVEAGPSGQRKSVCVGRVRYTYQGPYEVQVFTPGEHGEAGFAARNVWTHPDMWTVWSDDGSDGIALAGWASSLAVACDVLVNGVHVATGRHDSRRTSSGKWVPYVPAGLAPDTGQVTHDPMCTTRRVPGHTRCTCGATP